MLVIGIAGGVASGKSLVARCFQCFGAEILDADRVGHEVLLDANVVDIIVSQFGEIILKEGEIDRRALGRIVFDPSPQGAKSLKRLEQITHPRIGNKIQNELSRLKSESDLPAVVLDAPVMFKANWDRLCDKVVFVHSDIQQRRDRASQRGWNETELARRESQQLPILQKRSKATDSIDNSGSRIETYNHALALWKAWGLPVSIKLETPSDFFNQNDQ